MPTMRSGVLAALLLAMATACSPGGEVATQSVPAGAPMDEVPSPDRLVVLTVNYPLAYFAERIGGDQVEVVFPAPPDIDPAYWTPDVEAIAAYQEADLILLNGADYAKWVSRVSLPSSKLVDASSGFADRLIALDDTVTHSHGSAGEHTHTGWAFTTWLDPTLALEQAGAVRDALAAARPQSAERFGDAFEALAADLVRLDESQRSALEEISDRPLLTSHPVYQYFVARYDLDARSVHWEPDVLPGADDWAQLDSLLSERPAVAMIWEAEPLAEVRQRLEERGLAVLVVQPCANRPPEGDWLSVMQANQAQLASRR